MQRTKQITVASALDIATLLRADFPQADTLRRSVQLHEALIHTAVQRTFGNVASMIADPVARTFATNVGELFATEAQGIVRAMGALWIRSLDVVMTDNESLRIQLDEAIDQLDVRGQAAIEGHPAAQCFARAHDPMASSMTMRPRTTPPPPRRRHAAYTPPGIIGPMLRPGHGHAQPALRPNATAHELQTPVVYDFGPAWRDPASAIEHWSTAVAVGCRELQWGRDVHETISMMRREMPAPPCSPASPASPPTPCSGSSSTSVSSGLPPSDSDVDESIRRLELSDDERAKKEVEIAEHRARMIRKVREAQRRGPSTHIRAFDPSEDDETKENDETNGDDEEENALIPETTEEMPMMTAIASTTAAMSFDEATEAQSSVPTSPTVSSPTPSTASWSWINAPMTDSEADEALQTLELCDEMRIEGRTWLDQRIQAYYETHRRSSASLATVDLESNDSPSQTHVDETRGHAALSDTEALPARCHPISATPSTIKSSLGATSKSTAKAQASTRPIPSRRMRSTEFFRDERGHRIRPMSTSSDSSASSQFSKPQAQALQRVKRIVASSSTRAVSSTSSVAAKSVSNNRVRRQPPPSTHQSKTRAPSTSSVSETSSCGSPRSSSTDSDTSSTDSSGSSIRSTRSSRSLSSSSKSPSASSSSSSAARKLSSCGRCKNKAIKCLDCLSAEDTKRKLRSARRLQRQPKQQPRVQ